jgi:hypothetical protein
VQVVLVEVHLVALVVVKQFMEWYLLVGVEVAVELLLQLLEL